MGTTACLCLIAVANGASRAFMVGEEGCLEEEQHCCVACSFVNPWLQDDRLLMASLRVRLLAAPYSGTVAPLRHVRSGCARQLVLKSS
jgi:hypothetical protein